MKTTERYPEHAKLSAAQSEATVCGDFIDWLESKRYVLAEYAMITDYKRLQGVGRSPSSLIAEFLGIDERRLEEEKRAMLAALRK